MGKNRIWLFFGILALSSARCAETGYIVGGSAVGVSSFSGTAALPPPFDVLTITLRGYRVVVSPDGRTLYVLKTDGGIWSLPSDGSALESPFATVPLNGAKPIPSALAISPDGQFLYVLTNSTDPSQLEVDIYSVDIVTPTTVTQLIHDTTFGPGDITISTDGTTGYVLDTVSGSLYSFSTTTPGALIPIPLSLAFPTVKDRGGSDPVGWIDTIDDTHLIMTLGGEDVYKITLSAGAGVHTSILTQSGSLFGAVAVTPDKTAALLLDGASPNYGVYRVSPLDQGSSNITPVFLYAGFFSSSQAIDVAVGPALAPSPPGPPPPPGPPGPPASGLFPPSNVRGVSHQIGSLDKTVFYNQLDWEGPVKGAIPSSGYRIYRNGLLVAEVPLEVYTWQDPSTPQGGTSVTYSLVSVSSDSLSTPVFITITKEKNG